MKLNKHFTTYYLLVFNALYHSHVFINLSPHLYFPFPTESPETASQTPERLIFLQLGQHLDNIYQFREYLSK